MEPSLNLFKNVQSGEFAILNFTVEKKFGMRVGHGRLLHFSAAQMKTSALSLILANLRLFGTGDEAERCELETMNSVQSRKFHREHITVTLSQESDDCLTIYPMKRGRGGAATGSSSGPIRVALPTSNEIFSHQLAEAFEMCE